MEENPNDNSPVRKNRTITLKANNDYLVIPVEKIAYCVAAGSYTTLIKLDDGSQIFVSKSLAVLERCLTSSNFVRCHNSYYVNVGKI